MPDYRWVRLQLLKGAAVLATLTASAAVSFSVTRAARPEALPPTAKRGGATEALDRARRSYPSGDHLVAYVLLSHRCPFSRDKTTQAAVAQIRSSLKTLEGREYAKVSVVGVAVEYDLNAGFEYLRGLQRSARAFDELSIGRGWLNDFVTALVWRGGFAQPATPSVVVLRRRVDASAYPQISVGPDSLLLSVRGRPDLVSWVAQGTPIRSDWHLRLTGHTEAVSR